jgi:hypothetical protein
MAVAFDAISQLETNNDQNPDWVHTPSGTPTGILVFINKARPATTSSVTYGGTAMTLIGSVVNGNAALQVYGLASPPSGAQTVQINASGTNYWHFSRAVTFIGSHATTASAFVDFQSDFAASAASAADTLTVASATGDLVMDAIYVSLFPGSDLTMTEGADQTERDEDADAVFGAEHNVATSTQPGAASVAMDYSWGTSTNVTGWHYVAVNVVQAAAAALVTIPQVPSDLLRRPWRPIAYH